MKGGSVAALLIGVLSLAVGVLSRLMNMPIIGIESHAIVEFSQTMLVLSIALAILGCPQTKS